MEELLKELIEFLKSASPLVWAALLRQVYVHAFQNAVWAVLFVVSSVVAGKAFHIFTDKWVAIVRGRDDRESQWYRDDVPEHVMVLSIVSGILLPILVVLAVAFVLGAVSRFLNPEYYAIQLILERLK